jgi:thiamine biosynthesis lipoprotein
MPTPRLVEHVFRSMGTHITIVLPPDRSEGAELARAQFEAWDARFSRFRPDSELSRVNAAAGTSVPVSEPMFAAVTMAIDAANATAGAFDPLLATRLVELGYDRTFDELAPERRLPDPGTWDAGRWRTVELDARRRTVRLPAGTGLDLGGLAKGMAVDAATNELRDAGIPYAAVNAGGDLAVHGLPPGMRSWSILVEGAGQRSVTIPHGALATSTVLDRRWRVGTESRHHLLDPRTGLPVRSGLVLATVAAATCAQAEVAAKVALLRGPQLGASFLRDHGLAGLLVAEDGAAQRIGAASVAA